MIRQNDYILREIEKISIMLQGLLGKMIRRKEEGVISNEDEFNGWINTLPEKEMIDLDEILASDKKKLQVLLTETKGFNETNLEMLADLLTNIPLPENHPVKQEYLFKALEIYHLADEKYKTFSFQRNTRMEELRSLLEVKE